jgi:transcriptional regulator with XRE-family HTH domain
VTFIQDKPLYFYNDRSKFKGANKLLVKRLNEQRIKNNLTQGDVADILGVARTTYAMYEQGNREMDYASLLKLADFYKVSLDYLFGRSVIPIHPESYTDDEIEFMIKALNLYKEMKSKL